MLPRQEPLVIAAVRRPAVAHTAISDERLTLVEHRAVQDVLVRVQQRVVVVPLGVVPANKAQRGVVLRDVLGATDTTMANPQAMLSNG